LRASGSDTNIPLWISSKGTSTLNFYTNSFSTLQFSITNTASAVNYLQATGSAGSSPSVSAQGTSANVNVTYATKGTGFHNFTTGGLSTSQFVVTHTASAVNYLQVTGGATGGETIISSQGSDTNIDLALTPKGTGKVRFGTHTGTADVAITGYIEVKDSAGNVRKLAVIT
jgi:hypothetical protein